ncbi:hypothetical protein BGW36DRAFT_396561 [Talaromyces proteolyticus]|uniref:Alpha/beta hydrolase fold-3 domain-containing protein n=1 Tax=Talaromyces proteolyticus TaxID=1131652 RepID=A0AAD4KRQ2_9EURO|nr:uncharacterized protein BGW36DRAFT_396561 [Talaromyces proteolyticus]KAH8698930.1 hypothetical protein BGW36DRAFT_396561 [Talaromyces proteolyticus]
MFGFLGFVRYIRLRFLMTFSRLFIKFLSSPPKPQPDSVLRIPSRDKHRAIKVHVYQAHDDFCRLITRTAGYIVLDVEYSLGPEQLFPAAIYDVEDVLQYVPSRPDEYDASQASISGDPGLKQVLAPGGKNRPPFWTKIFQESYIKDIDPGDPRISPAYANKSNFPKDMLFVTAAQDASVLEAEEWAQRYEITSEVIVVARDETYRVAVDNFVAEYFTNQQNIQVPAEVKSRVRRLRLQ